MDSSSFMVWLPAICPASARPNLQSNLLVLANASVTSVPAFVTDGPGTARHSSLIVEPSALHFSV